MKKIVLFFGFTLACFISHAQFEVKDKSDNSIVTDGQTVTFSESGCGYSAPCNWKFSVTNTSSENIYMRIFVDNLTNTDGSNFQLCFAGVCLNNVSLNSGYPNNAAMIAPGATNSAGNNFWNQNPPITSTPMSWRFRFQAFDANGFEIGLPLTMTYSFNPNLSVDDVDINNISIYPSVTSNTITIDTQEDLSVRIYDILGKQVKAVAITKGNNIINVSDLSPQIYIVRLENNNGEKLIKKILVK